VKGHEADLGPWSERRVQGARLEIAGLGHTYPGGVRSLEDVHLTIQEGAFLAVMGANGSGKSTLLKHLVGLLESQEGGVRIDGEPVSADRFVEVAQTVGYLFQDPNDQLFCPTVGADMAYGPENLDLPQEEVDRLVQWAAETCGVADLPYTRSATGRRRGSRWVESSPWALVFSCSMSQPGAWTQWRRHD